MIYGALSKVLSFSTLSVHVSSESLKCKWCHIFLCWLLRLRRCLHSRCWQVSLKESNCHLCLRYLFISSPTVIAAEHQLTRIEIWKRKQAVAFFFFFKFVLFGVFSPLVLGSHYSSIITSIIFVWLLQKVGIYSQPLSTQTVRLAFKPEQVGHRRVPSGRWARRCSLLSRGGRDRGGGWRIREQENMAGTRGTRGSISIRAAILRVEWSPLRQHSTDSTESGLSINLNEFFQNELISIWEFWCWWGCC